MKFSILDIVQDVLSSMGSDEVNSIGDTSEAYDVARIVRRKYLEIAAISGHTQRYAPIGLEGFGNLEAPTLLSLPEGIQEIYSLKYDCREKEAEDANYKELIPLDFADFFTYTNNRRGWEDIITYYEVVSLVPIFIRTDCAPQYYTHIEDGSKTYILLDAYDKSIESTIHKSKTIAFAKVTPTVALYDNTILDLKPEQYHLLIEECVSTAWVEVLREANPKAENSAKRGWSHLMNVRRTTPGKSALDRAPDYGRKR